MLPNFIIIGAQKSASTFLQACLNDHPDIYLPSEEIPFFESPDYENGSIRDLEKLFDGRHEKCMGIKRPSYIGRPEVPERILSYLPNAKLLAVLRNPVDRAISAYFHYINYGFIPPLDVEIGIRKLIFDPSYSAVYRRSSEIIEFGYYHKYLRKYSHYMETGRLFVILQEELQSNPLGSIQEAYAFLGVDNEFVPRSLTSRPQKVVYNMTRLKVLRIRNMFMFDYNEERTRLFLKKMNLVEKAIVKAITTFDKNILSKVLRDGKPEISQDLRSTLYEKYAADIDLLESFIGRDLSIWRP